MNPNQQDRSIDYLNQIAPKTKAPLFANKWIPIGLGALVLLGIIIIVVGSIHRQPNLTTQVTDLYARLQTLQTISSTEQNSLKDTQLRATNSSLTLILNNSSTDAAAFLKGASNNIQIPQEIQKSEKAYLDTLTNKFNYARLNVELDSTYAREMAYQLNVVHTMMNSIYQQKPSKALSDMLVDTNNKLEPLQQTFANFSGAKE